MSTPTRPTAEEYTRRALEILQKTKIGSTDAEQLEHAHEVGRAIGTLRLALMEYELERKYPKAF